VTYYIDTAANSIVCKGCRGPQQLETVKVHAPCASLCPMSIAIPGDHVHAGCQCPCSAFMSMAHCPRPYPLSMSMPGVHVPARCRVRVRVHARVNARCPYPSYPCLGMNCLFLQNPTICVKKLQGCKNLAALPKHLISSYSTAVSLLQPSTIDEKSTLDATSRAGMGYVPG
jgi:hypothetical protein